MDLAAARAFTSARLGSLELKNRVIKAATYEGMTPGGVPGERLTRFHRELAQGGVAMTTVSYCTTEIHFGHGYGISQFISPRTNRRTDAYGGSFENRMRLPVRVLEAMRGAVGDRFPILGKITATAASR